MKKLPVFLGLVIAAGLASTSNAGFVNGDFETGDFTGWHIGFTENGMTGSQDVVQFDFGGGASNAARFSVGQINFESGVQRGLILYQEMYLLGGFEYELGCLAAVYNGNANNNGDGGNFNLFVGETSVDYWGPGSVVAGQTYIGGVSGSYTPAADGTYDVGVMITRKYVISDPWYLYQYVDDFYITPAPGALALLGLAGLIGRRRR